MARTHVRFSPVSLHAIAALVGALTVACSSDDQAPSRLIDGSSTPPLPVKLAGVTAPPVLTSVRVVGVEDVKPDSMSVSCQRRWGAHPAGWIVERMGVVSETVTFRDRSRRGLYGCDNSEGPREDDRRWCGGAFGRVYSGRLRDPRLDLGGCTTSDAGPVGFVWVEPHRGARYVVVEQPRHAEVYRVGGDLPVRVATTDGIEIEESRASLYVSEHDADGQILRRYQLDAAVSG